jgi:hypothetical protein
VLVAGCAVAACARCAPRCVARRGRTCCAWFGGVGELVVLGLMIFVHAWCAALGVVFAHVGVAT